VAEDSGLIVGIGKWVLREACRCATAWAGVSGTPLSLSVNLSVRQLAEAGFPELVAAVLEETGIEPSQARARGHGERAARRGGRAAERAPRAQGAGRADRARRLRHRLLVALIPEPAADRRPQARPLVRRAARREALGAEPGDRRERGDDGACARADGRGRGRRDRGAARPPPRARLRARAGLPVRPAHGPGRVPEPARAPQRTRPDLRWGRSRARPPRQQPRAVGPG